MDAVTEFSNLVRMFRIVLHEHVQLFAAIQNDTAERVAELFAAHTIDEEQLMFDMNYGHFVEHQKEHVRVMAVFEITKTLAPVHAREVMYELVQTHIMEHDTKVFTALKRRNIE